MLNIQIVRTILIIHPLFYATIALIVGIWLYSVVGVPPVPLFLTPALIMLCGSIGAGVLYSINPAYAKITLYIVGACIIGYVRSHYYYISYTNTIFPNTPLHIQGIVINYANMQHVNLKTCLTIQTIAIKQQDANNWSPLQANIQVYSAEKPLIEVGDTVELHNVQCKPVHNPSLQLYLIKEGITATIFAQKLSYSLINRPSFSINRWLTEQRERIYHAGYEKLSPQTFALFSSLFLGNRAQCRKELEDITEYFKYWGILHYLARSGLHLVIFVIIWQAILRYALLPFLAKQFLLYFLCIMYYALSWSSTPFVRAFLTLTFYKACTLSNVQSQTLYIFTLVCFLVLLTNPMQLFFLDFQLSYALTFALAWFNHVYAARTSSFKNTNATKPLLAFKSR